MQYGASALVLASRSGKVARDGQGLADQLKDIQKATKFVKCLPRIRLMDVT